MATYWNFRTILDVAPDEPGFTCVGITKKGKRCTQSPKFFFRSDLSQASELLDMMGAHKKLTNSYKYLEELAELTLCPRWHRKPGSNQVSIVAKRWKMIISERAVKVEREKENAAISKSKQALAEKKGSIVETKTKLEKDALGEEAIVKETLATDIGRESDLPAVLATVEAKSSMVAFKHTPKVSLADITPPPSLHTTPSQVPDGSEAETPALETTSDFSLQNQPLPSPPTSAPDSKGLPYKDVKTEHCSPATPTKADPRQTIAITETSSIKGTGTLESNDVVPKRDSREKTKIETLNFELPPTPDSTPQPTGHLAYEFGSGKQVPLPTFDLGTTATIEPSDVVPKRDSREKTKIETLKFELPPTPDSTPQPTGHLAYEFGSGKQVPLPTFDLGTTATLPISLPMTDLPKFCLDTKQFQASNEEHAFGIPTYKVPSSSFDLSTTIQMPSHEDPFTEKPHSSSGSASSFKPSPPQTKLDRLTPETTPESSHDAFSDVKESYGYAVVTHTSTRYISYLPSKTNNLATPPETPDMRGDKVQDPFLAFVSNPPSSVAALPREPLPDAPVPSVSDGDVEICEACGLKGDGTCSEDVGEESGGVGCFQCSTLRSLHKRVVGKANALKARASGVLRRQSD